jgi:hypothetical protein
VILFTTLVALMWPSVEACLFKPRFIRLVGIYWFNYHIYLKIMDWIRDWMRLTISLHDSRTWATWLIFFTIYIQLWSLMRMTNQLCYYPTIICMHMPKTLNVNNNGITHLTLKDINITNMGCTTLTKVWRPLWSKGKTIWGIQVNDIYEPYYCWHVYCSLTNFGQDLCRYGFCI